MIQVNAGQDRQLQTDHEDPSRPKSLTGFPKRAYDYYMENLRPLGCKLSAEIISLPEGMLGDMGIYLHW